MRRAERKLQLSLQVYGEDKDIHRDGSEDFHSLIFGLRIFGITEIDAQNSSGFSEEQLNSMTDKVLDLRSHEISEKDYQRFEINQETLLNREQSTKIEPDLEESSYESWVEKFKETSKSTDGSVLTSKRDDIKSKSLKQAEESKKAAHEKKLAKWAAYGYNSLSVQEPSDPPIGSDTTLDSGSVQFVYGDCTKPSVTCPSDPAMIFRFQRSSSQNACQDNSLSFFLCMKCD